MINWLENQIGAKYPPDARELIEFLAENKNKQIEFFFKDELFEILNFNKIEKNISGQQIPIDYEDERTNPFFLTNVLTKYLNRYFPNKDYKRILPFARSVWGDRLIYLFFCDAHTTPVAVNIDSETFEPNPSKYDISKYIPFELVKEKITSMKITINSKLKFSKILNETQYFFNHPDCICSVEDYEEILFKSISLYDPKGIFKFSALPQINNNYNFKLVVNNFSKDFAVEIISDYVDSLNFINILNEILVNIDSSDKRKYVLLNNICDFGIALVNNREIEVLTENGYCRI